MARVVRIGTVRGQGKVVYNAYSRTARGTYYMVDSVTVVTGSLSETAGRLARAAAIKSLLPPPKEIQPS